jgi:hypothetical protein
MQLMVKFIYINIHYCLIYFIYFIYIIHSYIIYNIQTFILINYNHLYGILNKNIICYYLDYIGFEIELLLLEFSCILGFVLCLLYYY